MRNFLFLTLLYSLFSCFIRKQETKVYSSLNLPILPGKTFVVRVNVQMLKVIYVQEAFPANYLKQVEIISDNLLRSNIIG